MAMAGSGLEAVVASPIPYCGAPPTPEVLLGRWNLDPVLIALLLALFALYLRGRSQIASAAVPRLRLTALALAALIGGCGESPAHRAARAIGDPNRGAQLTRSYGCSACHRIPGVPGAQGRVGPPLAGIGRRTLIAGVLPNTTRNMVRWLMHPQSVVPGNGMPDMEVSDHDAKDIAAYLHTLR